jgi:hypothetical protein
MTLDAMRSYVVDRLADKHSLQVNGQRPDGYVHATEGSRDGFAQAAEHAFLIRAGVPVVKPHPSARDLSSMSVLEVVRSYLGQRGVRTNGLTGMSLVKRAMSTSDFPAILTSTVGAAIRSGYEIEASSHRRWVRTELVDDFREQERVLLSSAPDLLEVVELGEYKSGSLDDDKASYRVAKFGRIIPLSWEALVNDRLGAVVRVQPALGIAARRKEADTVYAMLAENSGNGPTMQDGVALFNAAHGNVTAAGSMNAASLGAARTLLRKQKALGGGFMSLAPRYLVVPAELETEAELVLAAATRHATRVTAGSTRTDRDAATPEWIANLELVVEPRLASTAFYVLADNASVDTAVLGLLSEDGGGPVVEEEREFQRDAMRWKVRHVHGAKFLDWRGAVKVPVT